MGSKDFPDILCSALLANQVPVWCGLVHACVTPKIKGYTTTVSLSIFHRLFLLADVFFIVVVAVAIVIPPAEDGEELKDRNRTQLTSQPNRGTIQKHNR